MTTNPARTLAPRTATRPVLPPATTRTPADAEAWLSNVAVGLGDDYYLIWHYSTERCRFVGFDAYLPDRSAPLVSARIYGLRAEDVHVKKEAE